MGKRVAVISTEGKPWAMYARLSKAARAVDEDGIKVGDLEAEGS